MWVVGSGWLKQFSHVMGVYVGVQFYPWFKFYFPFFGGMVMLIMRLKQWEIKIKPRIKLNHNIYNDWRKESSLEMRDT